MKITYNADYPRRLRIAAIGCGGHALRNIFPTYQYAPVDLAAVCDLDDGRARSTAKLFGAEGVYTDHRAMLDAVKPDAVFVVTNYDDQGRPRYPGIAMDVMRAGAHAWIEKPPAASVAEVEEMMAVSAETGKFVGVGFKKMFFPANVKAKEIIDSPDFGGLTTITARYPQVLPPLERRGDQRQMVGFLDHMVHPHSLLRYLAGPVQSLFVQREERTGAAMVSIRFVSGVAGNLHFPAGQSHMGALERTEAVGMGAHVIVENNLRVAYYRPGVPGSGAGYGSESTFYGPEEQAPLVWEPEFSLGQLYNKGIFMLGYVQEILHFCESVLAGRAPAIGNLDDAHEMLRLYEAYLQPGEQVIELA